MRDKNRRHIFCTTREKKGTVRLPILVALSFFALFACHFGLEPPSHSAAIVTLASGEGVPGPLVMDDTSVYWSYLGSLNPDGSWNTSRIDGSIVKSDKDGKTIVTLASGLFPPTSMGINSTDIFWSGDDGIKKVSKDGGETTTLLSWSRNPESFPNSAPKIVVDENEIFWISDSRPKAVMKISVDGGTPIAVTVLSEGAFGDRITLHGDNLYWSRIDFSVKSIVNMSIVKMPKTGGALTDIIRASYIGAFALDDSFLYWGSDSNLIRTPIGGGTQDILATFNGYLQAELITFDDKAVYWASDEALKKLAKDKSKLTILANAIFSPGGLAVDSTHAFITNTGSRTVLKIPK